MQGDARLAAVVDKYSKYVNPYLARLMNFAGFGLEVFGEGCYISDQSGKKYLDCLGGYGVFSLGHRHPRVVAAVREQLDALPLSGKTFFSEKQALLAEKLAGLAPGDLQYTFFSNSGTEAVEAALKFAKGSTGRAGIVSTHGGYHGKTIGALATTGRAKYQKPFEPLMPGVVFVDFGDSAGAMAAIDSSTAAMIVEPIQGEGGIHVPPTGYLRDLRATCDAVGALLIVDEVQTGLGRTGAMFACEHDGIAPDIMTLAKCLGGGVMPIGATMGTPAIWEKIYGENPLVHTSTFGGNPLACAAGLAALEVIEEENLVERSNTVGAVLKEGLIAAGSGLDLIKEVRGKGMMLGVEFTMDEVGELTIAQMVKRGLVAAYTLNNPRVIRFEPPLIMTEEQAVWAAETFREAVVETSELLAELSAL
jgi:putrescine aminotransferase